MPNSKRSMTSEEVRAIRTAHQREMRAAMTPEERAVFYLARKAKRRAKNTRNKA